MPGEEQYNPDESRLETDDLGPVWKRFRRVLVRYYIPILAYVCLVLIGVGVWAEFQVPLYESTVTVLVDPTRVSNQAEKQSLENLSLQAALMSSPGTLNKVVETCNLLAIYPFNQSDNPIALLQRQMTVKPNLKSKTIDVTYLFISGEESAKIANAIAEAYVFSREEKSQGTTEDSLSSLQLNLLQEIEKQEKIKNEIDFFMLGNPEIEDESVVTKQIDYFNTELTKSDSELIELRTKILEIQKYSQETGSVLDHPYILENEIIKRQIERVRVAEGALSELKQQYREQHPDVISAQARVDSLQRSVQVDQERVFSQLKLELKTLESTRDRLKEQLIELKKTVNELAPQKMKLRNLEEERVAVASTIKVIKEKMSLASVEGGMKRPGVEILSYAKPGTVPAWPNKRKLYATAVMGGFVSCFGLIFLYCYFDRSLRTHDDVENVAGKLFLGDLTYARVKPGDLYPEFPNDKSFILFTHGLRLITTNIEFVLSDKHEKAVLFTSAVPGEGKSFVAFHVAQSMARQGKKVILIDADFCQSSLRDKIPKTDCEKHLYEYLSGTAEQHEIIEKTDNELIDFIRSGGRSSFSAPHALKSARMRDLLLDLKKKYDYVLVDTPPVLRVNDTVAVSQHVDMRVIVVRWAHTNRDLVKKAVMKIAPGQLLLSGVVLNQVKEVSDKGYHVYRPE